MGKFNDFFRRRAEENEQNGNGAGNGGYEYYEDTHSDAGDYTARLREFQREYNAGRMSTEPYSERPSFSAFGQSEERSQFTSPIASPKQDGQAAQNFMVYEPRTADDVQTLIDFLKTRESAIINLDNVEPEVSQRVLDFVSGAIYALNGSVHRVAGNIFLLSPEGVGITNSYEQRNNAKK